MLCSGLVCISLSLVSTYLFTTLMPRRDAAEPLVSEEDRLELQKDVAAAQVLMAVAGVVYMSCLWRRLFTVSAAEPRSALEDYQEEKKYEEGPSRRPSEHKGTQYHLDGEAQYATVETQTSDCLLPVEWTSSDSQLSDTSSSVPVRPPDTQMETRSCVSYGKIQQTISELRAGGLSPDYAQTSPVQPLLKQETTLDSVVQQASELQASKVSQTSERLQKNLPIRNVPPHLPVETLQSETSEKTMSQLATEPQSYDTPSAKAQIPPNAGDIGTLPNSAHGREPSDYSPRDGDAGLVVIREPTVRTVASPQTFTVSLAADQSPRRLTPPPRSPERNSCVPSPKLGSYAARRRITCNRCLNSRPQAGGQGNTQATDRVNPTTIKVTASPTSPTARGGGDAPQLRLATRQQTAGRGYRTPGKNQQAPYQTYSSLNLRPGSPSPRSPPTCDYKPPFV